MADIMHGVANRMCIAADMKHGVPDMMAEWGVWVDQDECQTPSPIYVKNNLLINEYLTICLGVIC